MKNLKSKVSISTIVAFLVLSISSVFAADVNYIMTLTAQYQGKNLAYEEEIKIKNSDTNRTLTIDTGAQYVDDSLVLFYTMGKGTRNVVSRGKKVATLEIPNNLTPGYSYWIGLEAVSNNYKDNYIGNSNVFYVKITCLEDVEETTIKVHVTKDGVELKNGETMTEVAGKQLIVSGTSNKNVKQICYKWNNGELVYVNGASATISIPSGAPDSTQRLDVTAQTEDGRWAGSKTFYFKLPAATPTITPTDTPTVVPTATQTPTIVPSPTPTIVVEPTNVQSLPDESDSASFMPTPTQKIIRTPTKSSLVTNNETITNNSMSSLSYNSNSSLIDTKTDNNIVYIDNSKNNTYVDNSYTNNTYIDNSAKIDNRSNVNSTVINNSNSNNNTNIVQDNSNTIISNTGNMPSFINNFTDVSDEDWYSDAVKRVVDLGLFKGTTETEFSPENNMTRAMIATVLYRFTGNAKKTDNELLFEDIDYSMYYVDAIRWGVQKGIITGTTPNTFSPDDSITREQLVSLLYRHADAIGINTSTNYNASNYLDYTYVEPYAVEAFNWAIDRGIVAGRTSSAISPQGKATRAEVATILSRYTDYVEEQVNEGKINKIYSPSQRKLMQSSDEK